MLFRKYMICLLTTWILARPSVSAESEFTVRPTKYGDVRGFATPFETDTNMRLEVFMGVPYAMPPIGQLRWARPKDPDDWLGEVRNTTSPQSCCVQPLDNIRKWSFGPEFNDTDEDCLYLNVYSPRSLSGTEADAYPVMVWVHGGSYRYGCGEEYDARVLAQHGPVTVVTINYRLGPLGFFSTEDEQAEGNYGLLDVVQALVWVSENIAWFGGDPERVTVFGQSAGGAATSHLLFSPLTEGLFHRVIPQSGLATSPWAVWRPPYGPLHVAEQLAEKAGCAGLSTEVMVHCLREKSAELLVSIATDSGTDFNSPWIPRVDGYFMLDLPETNLENGAAHPVDIMTGTVPDEMALGYVDVPGIEDGFTRDNLHEQLASWSRRFDDATDVINNALVQEYNWPVDDHQKFRDLFLEMRANDGYHAPHNRLLAGMSQLTGNAYLYSFEYKSEEQNLPDWAGVPHSEELNHLFGVPFWDLTSESCPWGCRNVVWYESQDEWTEADRQVSHKVMDAWVNFAESGDPSAEYHRWEPFNVTQECYTEIKADWSTKQYYQYQRMTFLNEYRPRLLEDFANCANNSTN